MTSVPCDTDSTNDQALVVPRAEHCISRKQIDENTLKVLYRLRRHGYQAYLVGGGVRDLLLERQPKDFDVATDATPEQVKGVFRNCRLIGRRFRLAHVHFGREIIEVATFRSMREANAPADQTTENGMVLRDNVYGGIEEDALRRDFTVNALYYNIADFSVIDYADDWRSRPGRKLSVLVKHGQGVACDENHIRCVTLLHVPQRTAEYPHLVFSLRQAVVADDDNREIGLGRRAQCLLRIRSILRRHTNHIASHTIRLDIFDVPECRSTNTMGISTIEKPFLQLLKFTSI